jgi:hypothetical protein
VTQYDWGAGRDILEIVEDRHSRGFTFDERDFFSRFVHVRHSSGSAISPSFR